MTTASGEVCCYRSQRLTLSSGERTWTVLGRDHRMVEPAEEYLEYLRAQQASPNTVKSYARALALWWVVPGCVRLALGRGEVGELRGFPDVAAHRGRARDRFDCAACGAVCGVDDRGAVSRGDLLL